MCCARSWLRRSCRLTVKKYVAPGTRLRRYAVIGRNRFWVGVLVVVGDGSESDGLRVAQPILRDLSWFALYRVYSLGCDELGGFGYGGFQQSGVGAFGDYGDAPSAFFAEGVAA